MSISGRRVEISLRVHPNAAGNGVVGFADGVWRVKIAAPPLKGRANRELITFLARKLGLSKGSLTIIEGHTSRNKVIAVEGLTQGEVARRLLPA
jgi:uncharacterized protein (TIGR00251 family)